MLNRNYVKDALLGVAIGDAVGVPVEFQPRYLLTREPVTGMRAYGSHGQPAGTWSDDSSLTFCLAEMLCEDYNLTNLANRFVNWKQNAYWTPYGNVFDIGIATSAAIEDLAMGIRPVLAGGYHEGSNGNGSLMRILPLLFFIQHKNMQERFSIISDVSSLTHRHIRSVIGCFFYLELALEIKKGFDPITAYRQACSAVNTFLDETAVCPAEERDIFARILSGNIANLQEGEIASSGYVIHTLEASIWCLLNTGNYRDAVLKAVNLGEDTDTTGAVTGGLAGLYYGYESIPAGWLEVLARRHDIETLCERLNNKTNF